MAQIQSKFIANNAITNAKLATIPADSYLGNNTASPATAAYITATQLTANLNVFTSALQGLTPASGGGTTNFLRADGTWASPTGTGISTISVASANGLAGTSSGGTSPTLTLSTSVTGILYGNGTSIAAATAGEFPTLNQNTTGTASNVTGTVLIANGGTGQTTAAAAYNALTPLTTAGDIVYEASANTAARLAIGSTGNVLTVVAGLPAWTSPALASVDNSTIKYNGSTQLESIQPNEERITLNSTNITNQYVDLIHPAFGSSASSNSVSIYVVGGPTQQKTVDYTVSLTGGSGGVTRITFAGDLASGGNAALIASDVLVVDYSYLA